MCGYFILRPIRESVGSKLGSQEIANLFLFTFLSMLIAVPIYSKIVSVVPRRIMIHVVFHFLAGCIVTFWVAIEFFDALNSSLFGRIYYVWVSFFSLFSVSVFWSVLADLFSSEQGKRLFGPIASGATLGALSGSLLAIQLVDLMGLGRLMLVSAAFVESGMIFASLLQRATRTWKSNAQAEKTEGNAWSGFIEVAKSPYLLLICGFLMFVSFCGTAVYLQLADAAKAALPQDNERTAFFASLNFWSQAGTLLVQSLIVSRIMKYLGVSVALMITPVIYLIAFAVLGMGSSILLLGIVDVARRVAVYGVTVPAREVLFTVVDREAKYKAKNFIDTVVYRGSDAATSRGYTMARSAIDSVATINWLMIPFAIVWMVLGCVLGIQQRKKERSLKTAKPN